MPTPLPADVERHLDKLKPAGDEWIARRCRVIRRGTESENLRCDLPAEIEVLGEGLIAVMGSRSFRVGCLDCDAKFDTKDDVVAHVHGARHRVECDDRVAYTYAPAELLDGVR